jgi:hypothetical protein
MQSVLLTPDTALKLMSWLPNGELTTRLRLPFQTSASVPLFPCSKSSNHSPTARQKVGTGQAVDDVDLI